MLPHEARLLAAAREFEASIREWPGIDNKAVSMVTGFTSLFEQMVATAVGARAMAESGVIKKRE